VESTTHTFEQKSKYETEIRELTKKVKELTEHVFELESQIKDEEQQTTIQRQEWHKREQQMERELTQLRDHKEEMTSTNATLQKRYESEMHD